MSSGAGSTSIGNLTGQQVITGSLYLLLSNRDRLTESAQACLDRLLGQNRSLNTPYALKQQLQAL